MSKQRPPWWGYVKSIIREYRILKIKEQVVRMPQVTARPMDPNAPGIKSKGKTSDPTADAVIHELPQAFQRKLDAVDSAIASTKQDHPYDAAERLTVIELVYWTKQCSVDTAADLVHVHRNTAGRWQAEFVRLVAKELALP